ncbi:uncharacterized protein LOC110836884 isoform X2 [Zootermopsis nevadensis]|uniref:uncharacterized protein LOC110836884 isoform X2 n=1 Tax=Zootermopsis nevadensis TaxID=136037 RepID=UPI000B8E642F|nr:uncharacterized protein LOC110836884 isoform X2 [Zootermopsis nevadensis]
MVSATMTQQHQSLALCQDGGSTSLCGKDFRQRTLRSLKLSLGKLWKRRSVTITEYDPTYKVAYLGNVLTGWAKGEGCVEKPLSTLWKNYTGSSKPDVQMKVTVTQSGLKAVTKEHGLTEYWSHRITYCAAPSSFPRIFCWVYRHEGRKLKQELRCHAVLCSKEAVARRMASQLKAKLAQSLSEFKRDKVCRQNARLSLANSVYENPSLPRRKILLSTGSHNYRPPLERSKSAPKLMVIEESLEEGEEECTDIQRDRVSRLHKDASVLNRLEEVSGEDTYQDHQKEAEELAQTYHDKDETEQCDSPRSLGTLRLQRVRNEVHKERNVISLDKCRSVASVISSDEELGHLGTNGSLVYRFDKGRGNILDRQTATSCGVKAFRGSEGEMKRKVCWNLETRSDGEDSDSWIRNVRNHHTERLLVIGSCIKDGNARRCIPTSGGMSEDDQVQNNQRECESDEGSTSLQSISSSASSSSDNSSRIASDLRPLAPYEYEDADIRTPQDEVEVDLHPTGGLLNRRQHVAVDLDRLSAQLKRSATFPPPSALGCANGGLLSVRRRGF